MPQFSYTEGMDKKFDLNRLNVKAFAREGLSLQGQLSLTQFGRLAELALSPVESSLQDSGEPTHVSWDIQVGARFGWRSSNLDASGSRGRFAHAVPKVHGAG
jgi:hypothetical protein